jgi:adenylosuccinate synthase
LIEGSQGFGLSLHHSPYYPYVTGRDTTAAAFLSEVGVSPLLVTEILMVLRTYPIRVSGGKAPFVGESTWLEVAKRAGAPHDISEYASVTHRVRRVAQFDWELASRAVRLNRPTSLAIHGIDYIDWKNRGCQDEAGLTSSARDFIVEAESRLGVEVGFVFTGPGTHEVVRRGRWRLEQPIG